MAKGDRLLAVARARVILPAAGAALGAAEIMHGAHASPAEVFLASAAAAGIASGSSRTRPLAIPLAAAGSWLTAATAYGPLAGAQWHYPLVITWSAAALAALVAAHRHPAVREARAWRAARRELNADAHVLGIRGAHLIGHETTRLGERWVLDVTGTGALASHIARNSGLAERIAQKRKLPKSRVRVTEDYLAGRVVVSIRTKDPWEHPIPHPLFDDSPELDLPVPCTLTRPFPAGQDPETGAPLNVTLWDEVGAKVVMVIGKRGAGKDVLLNNIRERVTAAQDADLWQVNVSKAQEERAWEQACEYSACGPEAYKKACQILEAACRLVEERGKSRREKATFRPTTIERLKVLIINEIDALFQYGDPSWVRAKLRYLASKARSEGVALVIASQRAVHNWIGGTDVKANVDYVCVGKVQNPGETSNAVGRLVGAVIPDMSTYGEGKPGVWCIVGDGGDYEIGRTFELPANGDLEILRDLAAERSPRVPVLAGAGNLPVSNLPASNHSPGGDQLAAPAGPPSGGEPPHDDPLTRLDAEMMSDLPPDLREQLAKITGKHADTKRILDETAALPPPPEVDQEQRAKIANERWRAAAEKTVIPDDARAKLLALLTGDGMSGRKITEAFPEVKRWKIMLWLNRLRFEGLARTDGTGAGARWVRTESDEK